MDVERATSKKGEQAAEGLRKAAAEEEAKNERNMGHDLPKALTGSTNALEAPTARAQRRNKNAEWLLLWVLRLQYRCNRNSNPGILEYAEAG